MPDELEFYVENSGSGNNLYYFAEALAGHALIGEAIGSEQDSEGAFRKVVQEILEVAKQINRFSEDFIGAVVAQYREELFAEPAQPVSVAGLRRFSAIRIDWFTDTSSIRADYAHFLSTEA